MDFVQKQTKNNFDDFHCLCFDRLFDMTNINHLNKNLFVHIKPPKTPKPSFVWNYFGHLHKKPDEPLDTDRIYCKVCFDIVQDEHPDVNLFYLSKKCCCL